MQSSVRSIRLPYSRHAPLGARLDVIASCNTRYRPLLLLALRAGGRAKVDMAWKLNSLISAERDDDKQKNPSRN